MALTSTNATDPTRLWSRRRVGALVMVVGLVPMGVSAWALHRRAASNARAGLDTELARQTENEARSLENYFSQARTNVLLLAQNPAFADFYAGERRRGETIAAGGARMSQINDALGYLEKLYPESIGEACFIDRTGAENARVVQGVRAPISDLSPNETGTTFFRPAIATQRGDVFQSAPYISPDTKEWVLSNATPIGRGSTNQAIVHFEVTLESFRLEANRASGRHHVQVIDKATGALILDSQVQQVADAPLAGSAPAPAITIAKDSSAGFLDSEGERTHFRRIATGPNNQNSWAVVITAPQRSVGIMSAIGVPLLLMAALLVGLALLVGRRWGRVTDALVAAKATEDRMRAESAEAEQFAREDGVRRVVGEYREFAHRVATGDLTARVGAADGDPGLASLATDMNEMVNHLGNMSGDVRDAAREIDSLSDRIFGVVSDYTSETTEQSVALHETTVAVDMVRDAAERAAGQAWAVGNKAREALTVSDESSRAVEEIMQVMGDIQQTVLNVADEISALSYETKAIQTITRTVNDIADQSNLLALNATIEAARAGEEGKGFAVVAEQVRSLAAESKEATRRVAEALSNVEQRTNAAVSTATTGRAAVEAGVAQARQAGSAIQQVAATLRGTAEAAAGISGLVQEQFASTDQIAIAVRGVAESTSRISDGAEQTREAAASLQELAARLSRVTERYLLDSHVENRTVLR